MTDDPALLELARAVTARAGYTRAMGTEVLHAERGAVEMRLQRKPELLQFNGFFHGGVISGLADHAAGGAATTALPPGRIAVTIDLHVNFVAPADGDAIVARARAVQVGGAVCTVSVEVVTIKDGQERTCSLATAVMRVVDMPRAPA